MNKTCGITPIKDAKICIAKEEIEKKKGSKYRNQIIITIIIIIIIMIIIILSTLSKRFS